MKSNNQKGFSLIELLLVVVVIGIVATIAVPAFQKGLVAAEKGNVLATLRSYSSTQVGFYSQNGRFGRFNEINTAMGNGLGTVVGNQVFRYRFVFDMVPAAPTDADLRQGYTVTATRNVAGDPTIYQYEVTHTGEITQILP